MLVSISNAPETRGLATRLTAGEAEITAKYMNFESTSVTIN